MVDSDDRITPWKMPKPNIELLSSSNQLGKLTSNSKNSQPAGSSPKTPTKSAKSKFLLPVNLTPFPFSPHSGPHLSKLITPKTEPVSKLDFNPSKQPSKQYESSSPTLHHSYGINEFDEMMETDDSFSSEEYLHELDDVGHETLCPWRCPNVCILDENYFRNSYPKLNCKKGDCSGELDFLHSNYEVEECIGKGSFSLVYRVISKLDGSYYALKQSLNPYTGISDRLHKIEEVKNLWKLKSSKTILQIETAWEQSGFLYIVTEYCCNGSLRDVLNHMSEHGVSLDVAEVLHVIYMVASGLQFIHGKNLVHMDLKPENILVANDGELRISDFGLARPIQLVDTIVLDTEGDKCYMAKEVLDGQITPAVDIFSLGLISLELATSLSLPKHGEGWLALREDNEFIAEFVPNALKDIILSMIDINAGSRPSATDLLGRILI